MDDVSEAEGSVWEGLGMVAHELVFDFVEFGVGVGFYVVVLVVVIGVGF